MILDIKLSADLAMQNSPNTNIQEKKNETSKKLKHKSFRLYSSWDYKFEKKF